MSLFPTMPRKKIINKEKIRNKIFVEQPPVKRRATKILSMETCLGDGALQRDCETTRPFTK